MYKNFLSVADASRFSGYHSDYLTQMCRKGTLLCRQISKVWFVSLDSIIKYLDLHKKASVLSKESIGDRLVQINESINGNSSFFIKSRKYVDSDTASRFSSYNRDYLTQLARSGDIVAKKAGKVWFFEEDSIYKHMHRLGRDTE